MTTVNPLTHPQHWSHHRRPQNEQEVEEYLGWSFTAHPQFELAIRVRERYPDLYGSVDVNIQQTVDDYARRRALASAIGRDPAAELRGAPTDDELDRCAAIVREADRDAQRRAYDAGRRRFVEAVRAGRWPYAEWQQWSTDMQAVATLNERVAGAAAMLGLRSIVGTSWMGPDALLAEIGKATGR